MDEKELIKKNGEQPIAKITDEDLDFLITREFPDQTAIVKTKLNKIQGDTQQLKNRISASVLKLSNKDVSKIDHLTQKANEDYRDIISAAEYPRTSDNAVRATDEEERKLNFLRDWEEYSTWKETGK